MTRIAQTPRPRHQYIVRGPDGIDEVLSRLSHGILACDCETSGLDWRVDLIGGLGFAAGDTAAFFCKDALKPAARWFGDQVKRRRMLVYHGGKFDMHMKRRTFGIHIPYPIHDTLTMSRLLDNRGAPTDRFPFFHFKKGHDLDQLAIPFVDRDAAKSHEELIAAIRKVVGRKQHQMRDWIVAPMRKYGLYGGLDPWYCLRLYDQFIERIRHWPQPEGYPSLMELYQNERWLTLALRDMEERGIKLNLDFMERWVNRNARRLAKLESKLNRRATRLLDSDEPVTLNWNSHPQVKKLFWEDLGLEQVDGPSTNKRSLLKMNHPLPPLLLKQRKLRKMVSSGKALIANAQWDGRLHCWFNQNVNTGRMSATDGIHQFARDSGVREGVVPGDELELRSADYSQIEMRFATHFSGEDVLIKGFNSGDPDFDTHAALARRMFGIGPKRVPSPQQRDRGKTMNFSMLYGAGEDAVTEQLIDKISMKEAIQSCIELGHRPKRSESPFRVLAQLLRDAVRDSYPKMWKFTKDEEQIAKRQGFVVDAFGYHRFLDEDEAYKAMNSKVQGSAAHQAKKGMVEVYKELQLGTGEVALIMQVHDDIVYESEGDPKTDRRVLELLEDHTTFKVPIVADLKGSADNWQAKKKITLKRRKVA